MVQIGNYNYSDYYSSGAYAPREGTLSYAEFDPDAYLAVRPDVAQNEGFTGRGREPSNSYFMQQYGRAPSRDEALYAHYQGIYPGDPLINLPSGFTQQTSDPFRRSESDVSAIQGYQTARSTVGQYETGISSFLDPDTNKIRQDLLGGTGIPEDLNLQEKIDAAKNATDPNDPAVLELKSILDTLGERKTARDTGYLGVFGEGGYNTFKQAVGSQQSYVDPYGKITPLGRMADLAENPELPPGTELSLDRYQAQPDEFLDADKYKTTPTQYNIKAAQAQVSEAVSPTKTGATSYEATQVADRVAKTQIQAAKQQGLTDYVEPAKGEVDVKSTVQGQLAQLMQQFEGGQIPAFAAGAIRTAEQRLLQGAWVPLVWPVLLLFRLLWRPALLLPLPTLKHTGVCRN
jgi:hypothetical protein